MHTKPPTARVLTSRSLRRLGDRGGYVAMRIAALVFFVLLVATVAAFFRGRPESSLIYVGGSFSDASRLLTYYGVNLTVFSYRTQYDDAGQPLDPEFYALRRHKFLILYHDRLVRRIDVEFHRPSPDSGYGEVYSRESVDSFELETHYYDMTLLLAVASIFVTSFITVLITHRYLAYGITALLTGVVVFGCIGNPFLLFEIIRTGDFYAYSFCVLVAGTLAAVLGYLCGRIVQNNARMEVAT